MDSPAWTLTTPPISFLYILYTCLFFRSGVCHPTHGPPRPKKKVVRQNLRRWRLLKASQQALLGLAQILRKPFSAARMRHVRPIHGRSLGMRRPSQGVGYQRPHGRSLVCNPGRLVISGISDHHFPLSCGAAGVVPELFTPRKTHRLHTNPTRSA